MSGSSPIASIIFVVAVERTSIKDEGFTGPPVHRSVSIPAIAMYEARLDIPPFGLQWQQKTRDHLLERELTDDVELDPLQYWFSE